MRVQIALLTGERHDPRSGDWTRPIAGSRLNEQAYALLAGKKALSIVPGATHLFEETGTLESAARKAANWFTLHLGGAK